LAPPAICIATFCISHSKNFYVECRGCHAAPFPHIPPYLHIVTLCIPHSKKFYTKCIGSHGASFIDIRILCISHSKNIYVECEGSHVAPFLCIPPSFPHYFPLHPTFQKFTCEVHRLSCHSLYSTFMYIVVLFYVTLMFLSNWKWPSKEALEFFFAKLSSRTTNKTQKRHLKYMYDVNLP
jgi:hypothetical protein